MFRRLSVPAQVVVVFCGCHSPASPPNTGKPTVVVPDTEQAASTKLPTADEACSWFSDCAEYGACIFRDGRCVVPATTDERCKERGSRKADPCSAEGLCKARQGYCSAASNEDCQRSAACRNLGRCTAKAGQCWVGASDESTCKKEHGSDKRQPCSFDGRCHLEDGVCVAGSHTDCLQSIACSSAGECFARARTCVANSVEHCRKSLGCGHAGYCTPVVGLCVVTSVDDCRRGFLCLRQGYCTPERGRCSIGSDNDCHQSTGCREDGSCAKISSPHVCAASSAVECQRSLNCRLRGRCHLNETGCVAKSTADCEASEHCSSRGYCTYRDRDCWVGANSEADCNRPRGTERFNPCEKEHDCVVENGVCTSEDFDVDDFTDD